MSNGPAARWFFRVLGPVRAERDGRIVPVDSPRAKVVLAMLVLDAGRVVSVDQLADAVWDQQPPTRAVATLQVHVSNLRRALGEGGDRVVTEPPGYRLALADDESDLRQFDAVERLARSCAGAEDWMSAEANLRRALGAWTGPPLADLPGTAAIDESRTWLENRHLAALEEHQELLLRLGRHRDAVPELERLVQRHPLRETLWELLIKAHYAAGSPSDALHAYRRARAVLIDELGVEPGERLRSLESAVLARRPLPDVPVFVAHRRSQVFEPTETRRAPGRASGRLLLDDGTSVAVSETLTIGRHPDCTVRILDPAVSRHHAEVRPVMGGCLLVDLSSANGTRVGGTYVAQTLLADNDVIEIGDTKLVFRGDSPTPGIEDHGNR
jgi:DNA-binding SARP family transcriptional activator